MGDQKARGTESMMRNQKTEYWKQLVGVLCLGWIVIWFARTMLTPVYAEVQMTTGPQSSFRMGMIASCYFLGYTVIQIPGGMWMDRVGRKKVMIPGLAVFAAGLLLMANARTLEMLYMGNLLAGLGTGTYYSGAFSLTGSYVVPEYKYVATAFVNNGCAFGIMAGYLFSGYFVKKQGFSWTMPVWVDAAAVLVLLLIFIKVLKEEAPASAGRRKQKTETGPGGRFSWKMAASCFYYFSACYGYYMISTWLPSFLEMERGMDGSKASVYACIVSLTSVPGALLCGRFLDRFGNKNVMFMSVLQCLAAVMLLLTTRFTVVGAMMLALGLYGFLGKQAIDPLIVPYISGSVPASRRSTVLGIFNFFGMSGSVLAPGITGYVEDLTGSKVCGFYIAVVLMFAGSVLFWLTNRTGGGLKCFTQS